MVFARVALTDGGFHETRERGEDVDGRVDALVVQLAVDEDLALGDVAGQIGNGVGDVWVEMLVFLRVSCVWTRRRTIVRHGQNGNLGDGTVTTLDTTGTLVHGGQISVHVTGVTTATGHLFTSGRDLTKGIAVGRQVSENDENVLLELVGVVLGGGESKTWGDNTFDAV